MPKCHSTNDIAADLASNRKISEGTVISTHNQTRGRGQRGNNWESLPGQNLTFSIIFFPAFLGAMQQIYLNYAISCGIIDYLDNKGFRGSAQVKWPNDIYLEQKKIGGILIENTLKGSRISQ